jgi:RNA polymerase-binding transcription factor DksA
MNRQNMRDIRDYLESVRRELFEELASVTTSQRGSNGQGKEEAAIVYSEIDKKTARINTIRQSLAEVEIALEKLEKGTYGLCNCCNNVIAAERLEAIPQTSLCIDCKKAALKER